MKISVQFDYPKEKKPKTKNIYPYEKECRDLLGRYFIGKNCLFYVFNVKKDKLMYSDRHWICETSEISWNNHIEDRMEDDGKPDHGWSLHDYWYFNDLTEVSKEEYLKIRKVIDMARTALTSIAENAIKAKQKEE